MTWSATPVDGDSSVKANESNINDAFTYADTQLKDDHYWDEDANLDGRHKAVQQKAQSADPTLGASVNLAWYPQVNTTAGGADAAPYAINDDSHKFYCGFRALVNFSVSDLNNVTREFHHNVSSVSRTGTGKYTITFDTALPTNKYIVLITVMGRGSKDMYGAVEKNATYGNSVSTSSVKIQLTEDASTAADPRACFVAIIGG